MDRQARGEGNGGRAGLPALYAVFTCRCRSASYACSHDNNSCGMHPPIACIVPLLFGNNSMCEVKLIHWHVMALLARSASICLCCRPRSICRPPCLPRLRLAPVELHASSSALSGPPLASRLAAYTAPRICSVELPPGRDKASFAGVWCDAGTEALSTQSTGTVRRLFVRGHRPGLAWCCVLLFVL